MVLAISTEDLHDGVSEWGIERQAISMKKYKNINLFSLLKVCKKSQFWIL